MLKRSCELCGIKKSFLEFVNDSICAVCNESKFACIKDGDEQTPLQRKRCYQLKRRTF